MASEPKQGEGREFAGNRIEPLRVCPRCSAGLRARSCKLVCERCGYYMSCSDFV